MGLQEHLFYSVRFKHFGINIEQDCAAAGAVLQVRHLVGWVFSNCSQALYSARY